MKADSRIFGKIEIEDDKIITLEKGMIGFPDLNHFALIYDEEKEKKYNSIMWLQSMDDPDIAFPVMMPHIVKEDYNPNVSEEMIAPLGKLTPENTYILVTVTKTPPAAVLLKKACKIQKGAGNSLKETVATISKADLQQIAETKMQDLNAASIEAAMSMIAGTARSMGIKVED